MNTRSFRSKNRQEELKRVAEQAAEWLVALEDDCASEQEALAQWLLESPLHTQMFLRAAAIDRKSSALHPTVLDRLMSRLEMEPDQNVLPLRDDAGRLEQAEPPNARLRRRWPLALAASLALAAAVGWYAFSDRLAWEHYTTDIGEQRSFTLQDGSIVHINTRSRVDVRYSAHGRDVRLVSGEALFTVQHDALRPFRVHINDTVVRAVGTRFNVYRRESDTTVSVIEGVVEISRGLAAPAVAQPESRPRRAAAPRAPSAAEQLAAGQAVTVESGGALGKRETVDVEQVTAWRQGELVFERASLKDIVAEFNRYNRTPQLRVDESIGDTYRYTAVFNANEPQMLLKFLARDGALEFIRRDDELKIKPRSRP